MSFGPIPGERIHVGEDCAKVLLERERIVFRFRGALRVILAHVTPDGMRFWLGKSLLRRCGTVGALPDHPTRTGNDL